eukprot:1180502-Prorocentrum_minimum.AAC.1
MVLFVKRLTTVGLREPCQGSTRGVSRRLHSNKFETVWASRSQVTKASRSKRETVSGVEHLVGLG